MKKLFSVCLLLCIFFAAFAQENEKPEMADALRSNGKIYVVVAVLVTILLGLFIYLWRLDKRITRLEKNK
jgi:predicted Na+-dependent transporter